MGTPKNPANDPRPCFCGCGKVCDRAQVKRWQWRCRRFGDVPGPFASRSCAMFDYHQRHPDTATRVGLEHRDRMRARGARQFDHISEPAGYQRDRAIYNLGYSAGRQAMRRHHERMRRLAALQRDALRASYGVSSVYARGGDR